MDEVADRGELQKEHLDGIIARLAPFYAQAATGPRINKLGSRPSSPTTMRRTFPGPKPWRGSCSPGNYLRRFATLPGLSSPGTGPCF